MLGKVKWNLLEPNFFKIFIFFERFASGIPIIIQYPGKGFCKYQLVYEREMFEALNTWLNTFAESYKRVDEHQHLPTYNISDHPFEPTQILRFVDNVN